MLVVVGVITAAWILGRRASMSLVLLLFAGIVGMVVLRYPKLALPSFVFAVALVPWTMSTGTGSAVNVSIIGLAAIAALWGLRMVIEQRIELRPSPANLPWGLLAVASGASIVAGWVFWDPVVTVRSSFVVVQMAQWALFVLSALAFLLGGNFARERSELRVLAWVVIGLGVLFVVQGILPSGLVSWLPANSFTGPLARIWIVSLSLAFALFDRQLGSWTRIGCGLLGTLVVIVSMTASRTWMSGWLPLIVVLIALVAMRIGRGSVRIAGVFAIPSLMLVFTSFARATESDLWSWETRVVAWQGLFELVGDRWLLGLGLGAYWHYWRGVLGSFSYLDPATGYLHVTTDPQVNMHNNYLDLFGQVGLVGLLIFLWVLAAIALQAWRVYRSEAAGFGRSYAAACLAGLAGMAFTGMLGDWIIPFVYNIGLNGFREASVAWLLLGGVVLLAAEPAPSRTAESAIGRDAETSGEPSRF